MPEEAVLETPAEESQQETPPAEPSGEKPVNTVVGDPPKEGEPESEAPESYTLALAKETLLESTDVERIEAIARTQGLSNDAAQELLTNMESQAMEDRNARVTQWELETKADKEIGGPKFEEAVLLANKAWDSLVPKNSYLRIAVHNSGIGSHPDFVRLMARLGSEGLAEDQPEKSGAETTSPADRDKDRNRKFYDHPSSAKTRKE